MSGRFARTARIATAAGAGVLLVLGLTAWELSRSGTVDAWLSTRMAALLGPTVRFGAVHAVWWPRPGVVLEQVALVPDDAPATGATAAALRCRVRLAALLTGRVALAAVRIEGLRVTVERTVDGALRAGGLKQLAAQRPTGGGGGGPPLAQLPAVQVRDADVALRADAGSAARTVRLRPLDARFVPTGAGAHVVLAAMIDGGGSVHVRGDIDALDDLDFTTAVEVDGLDAAAALAWLPPDASGIAAAGHLRLAAKLTGHGTAAIDGDTTLELSGGAVSWSGGSATSPLRLAGHASWNGTALALSNGRLDAARVSQAALSAETIAASLEFDHGAVRVAAAQLRAYGGTWRPSGRITLAEPRSVDGAVQAEGIDAAQLAALVGALGVTAPLPQVDAPLRLNATATGVVGGAWTGHAEIATGGAATWSGVRVGGPLQLAADFQAHGAAIALVNGRVQARRVAAGRLGGEAVDGDFAYADGAVRVAPLRGRAFGGAWTYRGTLPAGAAVAWSGQLAGTSVRVAALYGALAERGAAPAPDAAVDVSAQLTGAAGGALSGTATLRLASEALTWNALRIERPAELSAALRLQSARLTLSNGQARAHSVHWGEVAGSGVKAAFGYADDHLQIASLKTRAAGGRWHATATIGLAGPPSWSGSVDARHVRVDPLLRAVSTAYGAGLHSEGGIADLDLHLARGHDGAPHGSATVELASGAFIWDDLRIDGPAHARGTFTIADGAFTLTQATADAARAAYGPLVAAAATARLHYAGERLSFDDLRFQSCGGAWTHSGSLGLDRGASFSGQISLQGVAPHDLAAMLGEPAFNLPFARLDVDSEFQGRATPEWLSTLRASGSVFLSDGTMRATTVLRPIWEALVGPGRMMDAMDRATTHVEQLSGSFALRHSRVQTADLALLSDDYNITAIGSIGLDGSLDLTSRIQLTARGVQMLFVLDAIPLPTSTLPGLPPIPALVSGYLGNPIVRPNVSALPASTARWFVEALLHMPRTVAGTVLDGLGQLWNGAKRAVGAIGGGRDQPPP